MGKKSKGNKKKSGASENGAMENSPVMETPEHVEAPAEHQTPQLAESTADSPQTQIKTGDSVEEPIGDSSDEERGTTLSPSAEQLIEDVTDTLVAPLDQPDESDSHETVLANGKGGRNESVLSEIPQDGRQEDVPSTNSEAPPEPHKSTISNGLPQGSLDLESENSDAALRDEISMLRESLKRSKEDQQALRDSFGELNNKADRLIEEKTLAETQYRNLFGKVTQMKTTLGARLKQDSEELAQNRTIIDDLEAQNAALNETVAHMQAEVVRISDISSQSSLELQKAHSELLSMRAMLSETENLLALEKQAHADSQTRGTMASAEWENLLVEERSARDSLHDRIHDLEEQLQSQNSAYENLRSMANNDSQTISTLKNNIYELQEEHKNELRDTIEKMQEVIDRSTSDLESSDERCSLMRKDIQALQASLEKFTPYESEVREKTLLIGKLRHEAVILNEHLTKALRLLKRGASNDSVDRQLLNNLLLSFFQLPRQDSKRFEVLKILSSVLGWDDLQKEQAGLLRPGSSTSSLTLSPTNTRSPPMSPSLGRIAMSRGASGSLQLQAADFIGPNRESMSDLWINFLQSEAAMNAAEAVEP